MKRPEIKCMFCDKDLSNKKYQEDYILVVVDDVNTESELIKVAKPAHKECLLKVFAYNLDTVKSLLEEVNEYGTQSNSVSNSSNKHTRCVVNTTRRNRRKNPR